MIKKTQIPPVARCRRNAGFTLVELLLAVALGSLVVGVAATLYKSGMSVSFLVGQRVEMQQNARGAVHSLVHDLSVAGTGIPVGGVQLPSGSGALTPKFACNQAGLCYVTNNTYLGNRLTSVLPNPAGGPTIIGKATSVISLAYVDSGLPLNQYPLALITSAGDQITLDPRSVAAATASGTGVQVGDFILLTNSVGSAVGEVTSFDSSGNIFFANSDPLNINQSSAAFGNIKALQSAGPPVAYPATTATRILLITYYIEQSAGPDGVMGTVDDRFRLMRQVNGLKTTPVADNIENLQFSYDIFDDTSGVQIANTQDANLKYNQIRKVNVAVTARSASRNSPTVIDYQRLTLATSVSPRNLSYHDRYQ